VHRIVALGGDEFRLSLRATTNDIEVRNSSCCNITSDDGIIATGSWQHLAIVRAAAGLTYFYHQGSDVKAGGATNATPVSGGTDLQLGAVGTACTTQPFDGLIDDVRVYNRLLTAQEIFDIYSATSP
jgi:hypothetical protein